MPTQKLKLSLELHSRDGDFPVSKIRQYVSSRFSYCLHAVQTDKVFLGRVTLILGAFLSV